MRARCELARKALIGLDGTRPGDGRRRSPSYRRARFTVRSDAGEQHRLERGGGAHGHGGSAERGLRALERPPLARSSVSHPGRPRSSNCQWPRVPTSHDGGSRAHVDAERGGQLLAPGVRPARSRRARWAARPETVCRGSVSHFLLSGPSPASTRSNQPNSLRLHQRHRETEADACYTTVVENETLWAAMPRAKNASLWQRVRRLLHAQGRDHRSPTAAPSRRALIRVELTYRVDASKCQAAGAPDVLSGRRVMLPSPST
jgi:hypothetical protein